MTYISDRQMVEETLPSYLMLSVVLNGAEDDDPEAIEVAALLRQAAAQSLEHLATDKDRQKLKRRSERAYREAAGPWSGEGQSVGKFGLIVFYWLQGLIDAGVMAFTEDGPFKVAVDAVLRGLEPHAQIQAVDTSAQKQARKFHARLQSMGYFQGVDLG